MTTTGIVRQLQYHK